jgi:hypothetical protein
MPLCVRKGCEKAYEVSDNHPTACQHHSKGPIFHEGLKVHLLVLSPCHVDELIALEGLGLLYEESGFFR